jgi:hypothetical protein
MPLTQLYQSLQNIERRRSKPELTISESALAANFTMSLEPLFGTRALVSFLYTTICYDCKYGLIVQPTPKCNSPCLMKGRNAICLCSPYPSFNWAAHKSMKLSDLTKLSSSFFHAKSQTQVQTSSVCPACHLCPPTERRSHLSSQPQTGCPVHCTQGIRLCPPTSD